MDKVRSFIGRLSIIGAIIIYVKINYGLVLI